MWKLGFSVLQEKKKEESSLCGRRLRVILSGYCGKDNHCGDGVVWGNLQKADREENRSVQPCDKLWDKLLQGSKVITGMPKQRLEAEDLCIVGVLALSYIQSL
jgi:hypothetical protein